MSDPTHDEINRVSCDAIREMFESRQRDSALRLLMEQEARCTCLLVSCGDAPAYVTDPACPIHGDATTPVGVA